MTFTIHPSKADQVEVLGHDAPLVDPVTLQGHFEPALGPLVAALYLDGATFVAIEDSDTGFAAFKPR